MESAEKESHSHDIFLFEKQANTQTNKQTPLLFL